MVERTPEDHRVRELGGIPDDMAAAGISETDTDPRAAR